MSNIYPDPCKNVACENYAVCKRDPNTLKGYRCECQECAGSEVVDYVCGDDRRTYRNRCELKRASCRRRRLITISYLGRCGKSFVEPFGVGYCTI